MMINGVKTLGVYVHIPFCQSKCGYCDFYSLSDSKRLFSRYLDALIKQIREFFSPSNAYTVDSIYIGGGTPSYFGGGNVTKIIKAVKACAKVSANAEITVEANPESAGKAFFKAMRACGVNRISLGIQSSFDDELKNIGRIHNFKKALESIELCKKYCTDNISCDLIYGLPGQGGDAFLQSLKRVIDCGPKHMSVYALKLEEGTKMHYESPVLPGDDEQADMYLAACNELESAGFEQYEISNFARSGQISRHNFKYWDLCDYAGFGPSAHSFIGGRRYSIIRDVYAYIERMEAGGSIVEEIDELAYNNRLGEYIMLRLRTKAGIDPEVFFNRFKTSFEPFAQKLEKHIGLGYAELSGGVYRLTPKGFLVSNSIILDVLDDCESGAVFV